MEDYTAGDGRFAGREGSMVGGESIHPNYIFSMTARDMARFGYLYLRGGRWKDPLLNPLSRPCGRRMAATLPST
jgi:CubicO group peptidase (beta-lactamase class C family)